NQIQPAYISQLPDDYDNDGFQDFLVRFNMSELLSLIVEGNNLFIITGNITNPLSESFYLAGASSLQFNGESPNVPGKPLGNISVNPYVNLTLTTSSFDPENSGIYYRFDWGDGNISNWFGPYKSGENCIVNHLWIYCGEYLIQAQAMDIWGHKTGWSDSLNVIVNNAPVANANGPYSGPEGLPVILDATGSYDPDGDPLQYFWDLDDDGFFDDSTDIMPSAIWCDDYVGTVTLKVADWHCNDTDSSKIKIFNVAPTVNAGSDTTILMKNAIERIGVITDPGCDKWEIKIDYGDDSPSLTYLNQTVKIFDIFHEYNSTGEYIVKVDVKDDDDGYGSDTILVYVICLSEVWVDDNWFCQADVDKYDPSLTWQWDAWNSIQDAVDVVCEGGIVHVLNGIYWEVNDILLYKQDVQITGVNQPPFDVTYNTAAVVYTPMIVTADGICIQQFAFMPEPGVPSITVDINLDADTARTNIVKINHNKFMRGCEGDAVAIENKAYGIVDACFNWWGAMDGPSGNVVDPCTGRVAEGFGASIVDNGPVHFDPWAGLDACGNIRLIRRLMIFDGSCSFAYHLDGTTNTNIEYLWNFGDKHYSHDKSGAHLYINPGVYTVTLRIKASDPDLHHTFMYDWENFKIVVK
ncbi:MAG: PKD domain-containing protein, partial [Candidatus Thermoplasmatota archaeon]|nr:PKD domain-containing protein [Candidatus Thermoplasmatota archaeon]